MENDFMVMICGALMGVVGSIVTSIVTTVFQSWLERREHERRRSEEHASRLLQIHLPTDEDVRTINAEHQDQPAAQPARTMAEAGAVLLSILLSSTVVYQTRSLAYPLERPWAFS
jgi:hypothetical protein